MCFDMHFSTYIMTLVLTHITTVLPVHYYLVLRTMHTAVTNKEDFRVLYYTQEWEIHHWIFDYVFTVFFILLNQLVSIQVF